MLRTAYASAPPCDCRSEARPQSPGRYSLVKPRAQPSLAPPDAPGESATSPTAPGLSSANCRSLQAGQHASQFSSIIETCEAQYCRLIMTHYTRFGYRQMTNRISK